MKGGEEYLRQYPSLEQWINRCVSCGAAGLKPEMPEHVGGEHSIAAKNLRKLFRPLSVNTAGQCEQCASAGPVG